MRIEEHQVKDTPDWPCNFLHLLPRTATGLVIESLLYFTGAHGGLAVRMRGTVDLAGSGDRILAAGITRVRPCASDQE
jgi:hypothetical protein